MSVPSVVRGLVCRDAAGNVELDSGRLSIAAAAATLAAVAGLSSELGAALSAPAAGAGTNAGNEIRFFKNGKDQNVAFSGIQPGKYRLCTLVTVLTASRGLFGAQARLTLKKKYTRRYVSSC